LRKRSLVYDELCIKDNNRAMSDGYWFLIIHQKELLLDQVLRLLLQDLIQRKFQ
jgi:hypothetical protein